MAKALEDGLSSKTKVCRTLISAIDPMDLLKLTTSTMKTSAHPPHFLMF